MSDLLGRESGMLMMGLRRGYLIIVELFALCIMVGNCGLGIVNDSGVTYDASSGVPFSGFALKGSTTTSLSGRLLLPHFLTFECTIS